MESKLGIRKWLSFIIAGFVGQLAWAIENNYLNLYVHFCTDQYSFIPVMTALSAVTATLVTLFMGALSDRLGKRKLFISFGYIVWGISIILFAFLDPKNNITIIGNNSVFLVGSLIVVMDCVMTFFGSTANDASFNAYVTDKTNPLNRGRVESVLSILPLIAMIAVVVVGGIFVDKENPADKRWDLFFYIFGGLTIVAGLICIFLLPKDEISPNKEEPYLMNIIHGFRPRVVKDNQKLYLALLSFMVFNIAINVFMPYMMVYIQTTLGIVGDDFTITLGVVLISASALTVLIGAFMDKIGKNKIIFPALASAVAGGVIMTFVNEKIGVMIGGIILMAGYLICTAVLGAKVRDYTPINQAGLFQGVRMVFVVMIPMVTGPYIGQAVSLINAQTYVNEYNQTVTRPNQFIFLFTSIVLLFVLIPLIILLKKEKLDETTK